MDTKLFRHSRVALREEGDLWVAYYAQATTMKDAIFLASCPKSLVVNRPVLKEAFMLFAKQCVEVVMKEATGAPVAQWDDPQVAPDFERGSRA